jgi:tetratricopeptide (TPR) repeat protein
MKLSDLKGLVTQLKTVQGIERDLIKRKYVGTLSWIIGLAGAVYQVILPLISEERFEKISAWISSLDTWPPSHLPPPELIGLFVLIAGLTIYFITKRTGFLLSESREPFRYTFWIESFKHVNDGEGADEKVVIDRDDKFHNLLHHDLMERLNQRIRRLSLLNETDLNDNQKESLSSHIHIDGYYTVRELKEENDWIVHVMPRIRIGASDRPATLAHPVKFPVYKYGKEKKDTETYNRIIERIYSSVATEIYRRIKTDIEEKMGLFPTGHLRALAYFYEAKDFARSNTIDAYDHAIELYKQSLKRFDTSIITLITRKIVTIPYLWRIAIHYQHMHSKIEIEYAKCIIYRRQLSALSGRYQNPLFEIREMLDAVIIRLMEIHNRMNDGQSKLIIQRHQMDSLEDSLHLLDLEDIKDARSLAMKLQGQSDELSKHLYGRFSERTRSLLDSFDGPETPPPLLLRALIDDLNLIIQGECLYNEGDFRDVKLSEETQSMISENMSGVSLARLNRIILEESYSQEIRVYISQQERITRKNRLHTSMTYLTFPEDSWNRKIRLKPGKNLFELHKRLLFDAYVVSALTYYHLSAVQSPRIYQEYAKAVAPALSERNALYLLTSGFIEPDIEKKIVLLRRSTEATTDFEMAQYSLAYFMEIRFRMENEITPARAENVIKEYDEVLRINPGNIASLVSQGHLLWLTGDRVRAEGKFREGLDIKAIAKETFVGELNYCLARIAAEKGDFERSYNLFTDAVSADPAVGAYSPLIGGRFATTAFFDNLGTGMLDNYRKYRENVAEIIAYTRDCRDTPVSHRTLDSVLSYVLNDYGNACLNYYHRFGDMTVLDRAIESYRDALSMNERYVSTYYNLSNAYMWRLHPGDEEKAVDCLVHARGAGSVWLPAVVSFVELRLQQLQQEYDETINKAEELFRIKDDLENDLRGLKKELQLQGNKGFATGSAAGSLGSAPQASAGISQPDTSEGLMARIRKMQEEHENKTRAIGKLFRSAEKGWEEGIVPVTTMVEELIKGTKLSSVYAGFEFNADGGGIDKFLMQKNRIERSRLDEYDVVALRLWASILASSHLVTAQIAGKNLCEYINAEFYPENFDISIILINMYRRMLGRLALPSVSDSACREETADACNPDVCRKHIETDLDMIRLSIHDWLVQDPVRYVALMWVKGYFPLYQYHRYLEKVIEDFIRSIESPLYWVSIGNELKASEKWNEIVKAYQGALEMRRIKADDLHGFDYYYDLLSEAYFRADRLKEFEMIFDSSPDLEDEPEKKAIVYNRIGNLFAGESRDQEAIEYYEKAIEFDSGKPIYECNLGSTYGKLPEPDWDEMIRHCGRSVELRRNAPDDPYGLDYYYSFLAEGYFNGSRLKELEELFETSDDLKDEPEKKADIYNRTANLLANGSQEREAIEYYEKAIELDSTRPIYECNLGLTYGKLPESDWDEMIRHCRRSVELRRNAPDDPYGLDYYYDFLAEGYFKGNRLKEFEGLFETSGDLNDEPEKKAVVYNRIGNLLAGGYREQEAIGYYIKAISLDSKRPIYECNLGLTYGKLPVPNWDNMIIHFSRSVELRKKAPADPYGLDYYYGFLAEGYLKGSRLKEFEDIFEKSGDLNDEPEKKADIYNRIGNLLAGGYQEQEAIEYYEKAISLDSARPIYECNLGLSYGKLPVPNWDEMINHCRRSVELRKKAPGDPYGLDYYYEFLAEAHFKSGRLMEFEELFEKSGDLNDEPGKKAIVYNRIGNLLAGGNRVEEAIQYYEKAIKLDSTRPIYECNLGLTFGRLPAPDWDEMINHCRRSVELRRNDPEDPYELDYYYGFLAGAYVKSDRLKEFEVYFETSDDLRDEPEKRARVYNQIGNAFFELYKNHEAMTYYKQSVEHDRENPIYECNLGRTYGNLLKWHEMIDHCRKAVELRRYSADDPYDSGYYYSFLIQAYESAITSDPDNAGLIMGVADTYFESKDYGNAADRYVRILDLNRGNAMITEKLIRACEQIGDTERAGYFLETALQHIPEDSELKEAIVKLKK